MNKRRKWIEFFRELWILIKKGPEGILYDSLTGVYQRKFLPELGNFFIARAKRGQKFSLVFIDLDDLRRVNNTLGHQIGDTYLKSFCALAEVNLRETDIIIRYGGDEFLLFLDNTDLKEAEQAMERFNDLFPHFSFGISSWKKGMSLEEMVKEADELMYLQKKEKKMRK